ncbi:hypothetical protein BSLG_001556 [Batrachochytrium salamandrivorans]|nr:hypothetical protein BSLG_001556 [Batrachochytrium salamandrivorans]
MIHWLSSPIAAIRKRAAGCMYSTLAPAMSTLARDTIYVDHMSVYGHECTPDFALLKQVIGAGVVGLAIAERLSRQGTNTTTLLVDQWPQFGSETSSRNSQVVHAGIYYPKTALKTTLCIRGRELLYDLCKRAHLSHRQLGKWIVAVLPDQADDLYQLHLKAQDLAVPTYFLDKTTAQRQEPNVYAHSVLVSPTTGIIDSHEYMQYLESSFISQKGITSYRSKVTGIEKQSDGRYMVRVKLADAIEHQIVCRVLVNSAGLAATEIASMLLPRTATATLRIQYFKGHYFAYKPQRSIVSRLIYPMPDKNLQSLGIHCTLDMEGGLKFGPDVVSVELPTDYTLGPECEEGGALLDKFHSAISGYLPLVNKCDLRPDFAGIRPKLYGPGEDFRDFVVEIPDGFDGFVNLVGIESPGLTSSLAIAEYVLQLLTGSKKQ